MGFEAWFTLAAVAAMAAALIRHIAGPDVIVLGTLSLLMLVGIVDPAAAVRGFGNEGLVTVGALFVVVCGLTQTGAVSLIVGPLLGRRTDKPGGARVAQARLMLPVAGLSAFLNNTPIVAMFIPVVSDWCRASRISPSKLMMPLSFAAILGGTCTLIGTSTNLVVNGLLIADPDTPPLSMFDLTWVGLPCAVVGLAYCLLLGPRLLPERKPVFEAADDARRYTVDVEVEPGGPVAGKTVEEAGLRSLPGLYLAEIERDGRIMEAVGPAERLEGGDRLVFVGVVDSVVDLRKRRGLRVASSDQIDKMGRPVVQRFLVEAVVSDTCSAVGKTVRGGRFRTRYGAAIIAVARNGRRINRKIGDIVLQPGDTLLLEATTAFLQTHRQNRDFFLVSPVADSAPPRHRRAWVAGAVLLAMVVAATAEWVSLLQASIAAAVGMVLTRCCTGEEARRSLDWPLLLVIGGAFGVSEAVEQSGLADAIGRGLVGLGGGQPWLTLVLVYAATMLFTAFITNNAAAVLLFPIAKAAAIGLGVNVIPFAVAIMLAASNDFATPIGYQTNLMVYGPGGYRFSDYLKFGLPLNLLVMAVTVTLTPLVWPL